MMVIVRLGSSGMDGWAWGLSIDLFVTRRECVCVYVVVWKEGLAFSTYEDEVAVVVTGVVSRWHKVQVRW